MTVDVLAGVDPFSVRVSVYKNLRTGGWSIKTAERVGDVPVGKVIAHADRCALTDCRMVVKAAAVARMVAGDGPRGRKRNVFAWVDGKLADGQVFLAGEQRVLFHPFERPDFHLETTGETVVRADAAVFDRHGRCWI